MNKKLLAVAVASVLAAPATALAQVTISGIFKVGIEQVKLGGTTRSQSSQIRVDDNSSRIIFGVTEDLGGGLAAIAQVDMRFQPDGGGGPAASGNTWVGLRSSNMGSFTLGRHDLHYGKQPDDIAAKAGALHATAVSLMDHAAGGVIPVAITSRTANAIRWDSPNWSGFTLTAAYSTAPFGGEGDMTPGATFKGSATNLNPAFTASNWQVGASIWSAKTEGGNVAAINAAQLAALTATAAGQIPLAVAAGTATPTLLQYEEKANVLYGYYRLSGWKFGFAVNNSKLSVGGDVGSNRRAWTIPVSYTTGANNFYAHYTKADNDKECPGCDTGAKMMAFAYVYDLSKRTSVGVTYAKIDNGVDAAYNFFTSGGALGSADGLASATVGGEDPQLIQFTVRHAF